VTRSPGQHEVTPFSANGFRLSATDRETYRQTDRKTDAQTDTQRDLDLRSLVTQLDAESCAAS